MLSPNSNLKISENDPADEKGRSLKMKIDIHKKHKSMEPTRIASAHHAGENKRQHHSLCNTPNDAHRVTTDPSNKSFMKSDKKNSELVKVNEVKIAQWKAQQRILDKKNA